MKPASLGFAYATAAALLFSAKGVLIKLAYGYGAAAPDVLSLRLLLAAPIYAAILLAERRKGPFPATSGRQWAWLALVGFLGYYLSSYLDFWGLQYLSAGMERMVLFLYPSFVVLLGVFILRKRLGRRMVGAMLLSYAGVALCYAGDADFDPASGPFGAVLVLGAALSFAFYLLLGERSQKHFGTNRFTALSFLFAGLLMNVHYLALGGNPLLLPGPVWLIAGVLAVLGTVVPSLLMMHAIRLIGSDRTAIAGGMGPVMTLALSALFLGEGLGVLEGLGVAATVVGGFIAKGKAAQAVPVGPAAPVPLKTEPGQGPGRVV